MQALSNTVTHLVANEWGSEKCKVAHELGKPIMTEQWVRRAWAEGANRPCRAADDEDDARLIVKHRLPVLKGKTICVTGITAGPRQKVEKLTKKHGGVYSATCHKDITHLLALEPKGDKYKFAAKHKGIHIVDPSWLDRSIDLSFPVDEKEHSLLVQNPGLSDGRSITDDERTLLRSVKTDRANLFFDGVSFYLAGVGGDRAKLLSKIIRCGGGVKLERLDDTTSHIIHSGQCLPGKDQEQLDRLGTHPTIVEDLWLIDCCKAAKALPLPGDDADVPATAATAAFTQPKSDSSFGRGSSKRKASSPPPAPAEEDLDDGFMGMFGDTLGDEEEGAGTAAAPATGLTPGKSGHRVNSISSLTPPTSRSPPHAGERTTPVLSVEGAAVGGGAAATANNAANAIAHNDEDDRTNTFAGISFFINPRWCTPAVKPKLHSLIVKRIEDHSGRVATDSDSAHVLFTHNTIQAGGDSMMAVSKMWFEACVEEQRLLDPRSFRGFQPLKWDAQLDVFASVCLCFSGFGLEAQLNGLHETCKEVGAEFAERFTKKKVTHLICCTGSGQKFNKAKEWGMIPVSPDWLFQCVEQRRLLPLKKFPPAEEDQVSGSSCTPQLLLELKNGGGIKSSLGIPITSRRTTPRRSPRKIGRPNFDTNDVVAALQTPKTSSASETMTPGDDTMTRGLTAGLRTATATAANVANGTLLEGVTIFISTTKKLDPYRVQIETTARALGAAILKDQPRKGCHYIFRGKKNDAFKEFKTAAQLKCPLIAPEWIFRSQAAGERQPETMFPHTFDANRALGVDTISTTRPSRSSSSQKKRSSQRSTTDQDSDLGVTSPRKKAVAMVAEDEDEDAVKEVAAAAVAAAAHESAGITTVRRASPRRSPAKQPLSEKPEEPTALANIISRFISTDVRVNKGSRQSRRSRYDSQSSVKSGMDEPTPEMNRSDAVSSTSGFSASEKQDRAEFEDESSQIAVTYADPGHDNRRKMLAKLQRGAVAACFLLSGLTPSQKNQYSEIIKKLGGTVIDQQYFDLRCTHVVVGTPTRSEKYLAACAAGKWVLQTSYLDESDSVGVFIQEEPHEWALNVDILSQDPSKKPLIEATRRWRIHVSANSSGAFHDWKVVLFVSKVEGFKRLLEAGGATVIKDPSTNEAEVATHCFVDKMLIEQHREALAQLDLTDTLCLKADYIAAYLTVEDPPATDYSWLAETSQASLSAKKSRSPNKRLSASAGELVPAGKRSRER